MSDRDGISAPLWTGWIYFLRWGPYVKIGCSRFPIQRSEQLWRRPDSILCPEDLTGKPRLVAWVQGDLQTERAFHIAFAYLRVVGEWYRESGALADLMEGLDQGVAYPLPKLVEPAPDSSQPPVEF